VYTFCVKKKLYKKKRRYKKRRTERVLHGEIEEPKPLCTDEDMVGRLPPHCNRSHDGTASASGTDHDHAGAEAPLALAAGLA